MIEFHSPELADKSWIDARLAGSNFRGCEYSFTTLFLWGRAYDQTVADEDGFLVVRACGAKGYSYLWPAGDGDLSALLPRLEEDAALRGQPFRMLGLTPPAAALLEQLRPGEYDICPDRDRFDYLYEVDKLADLGGRKLHSKRNHCKRFQENNPGWSFHDLTPADLPECLALNRAWEKGGVEREGSAEAENINWEEDAIRTAVTNFDQLDVDGGIIRVDGRVVAFTMGHRLAGDTYDVNFEKAYGEIQGAYAMINREFARRIREKYPDVRYLNREEDMGLESLRKAKSSYYPDLMVEKYTAVRKTPDREDVIL